MNLERGSGILMHLTSLPSPFGIGDFGPSAFDFVDQLAGAKQKYWQILPLNPTDPAFGNSPYLSASAFALNPLLISLELLKPDGLLIDQELADYPQLPADKTDYESVHDVKMGLLQKAWQRWKHNKPIEFQTFCRRSSCWLDDYALFMAFMEVFEGRVWSEWSQELRDREPSALEAQQRECADTIDFIKFQQFVAFRQWSALHNHARGKGIQIIGDLPIYIEYGSSDVWCHPERFKLDERKQPYVVAGVPPDYFSTTGQRWGNPIYDWEVMQNTGFSWWTSRLRHNLELFDIVRIDHFRGLVAYWQVPAEEETAINGTWVQAPTEAFFSHLQNEIPNFNVIAEDLGLITDDVREALKKYDLSGMKVLLFAFSDNLDTNPYLPHNYPQHCIVYTGTHDNNTAVGWFNNDATDHEKSNVQQYLGRPINSINRDLIELALASPADVAIIPLQDVLGLDERARMNTPGTLNGNWSWRIAQTVDEEAWNRLTSLTQEHGRS